MRDLTVIILTLDEEMHIERCINAVSDVASEIVVVDSFSSDRTVSIASACGAKVYQHEFINHAAQLDWAINNLPIVTSWLMRVDADEIVSEELSKEITMVLQHADSRTNGFLVPLIVNFKGTEIRFGGMSLQLLRIWRHGKATVERAWMDEHVLLNEGSVRQLSGKIVDHNLKGITWWTEKHNKYATREAIALLGLKYRFDAEKSGELQGPARFRRMMKNSIYSRMPLGWRVIAFFMYRSIFRLGVLDGVGGMTYHFLQGFWYRFLVDVKIWEVERRMSHDEIDCKEAIRRQLGVEPLF